MFLGALFRVFFYLLKQSTGCDEGNCPSLIFFKIFGGPNRRTSPVICLSADNSFISQIAVYLKCSSICREARLAPVLEGWRMQSKTLCLCSVPLAACPLLVTLCPMLRVSKARRECDTRFTDLVPLEKLSNSSLDFMKSNL